MNREFLYELLETASVSGFEEEIQRKVIKYARGFADEIYTDEIADVVSIVNPDAEIKVMLSAHMDEIGLMISHITEKGMLHVSKAGGIYPGTYLGQKVRIMHEGNVVYGAVRNHGSLNKKELEITDIIIDIGAVSREDAMAHVACGDPVSFDTDYRELLNDRLCARGLDDRRRIYYPGGCEKGQGKRVHMWNLCGNYCRGRTDKARSCLVCIPNRSDPGGCA